jgi:hypothetical protein
MRLVMRMVFQGLGKDGARAAWRPLLDLVKDNGADYEGRDSITVASVPTRYVWNAWVYCFLAPSVVRFDSRPGASWTNFWWTGDSGQVGAFWYAYSSAWLPAALLKSQNQSRLVDAWFAASRHWGVSFHFNKGLAGAPAARSTKRGTPP